MKCRNIEMTTDCEEDDISMEHNQRHLDNLAGRRRSRCEGKKANDCCKAEDSMKSVEKDGR